MSIRQTFVEIELPVCTLTYGESPCTAALGVTGDKKCFNTRKTCQDIANYDELIDPAIGFPIGEELFYSFDDVTGPTVTDDSGNSNDGTITGSGFSVSGVWDDGLSLPTESDYLTIPLNGKLFASGEPWSFTFWEDATGVLLDNGNIKIEVIDSLNVTVTVRGLENKIDLETELSGFNFYSIVWDGFNLVFSIDLKPSTLTTQVELLDSDGVNILDTDGNQINANYEYWRI
jgi:hypothetical protein